MPSSRDRIGHNRAFKVIALTSLALSGAGWSGAQSQEASVYEIDVASSDVHWLVYRAGAFARFGHNHIILVGEGAGRVFIEPELSESRFELEIPVAGLVVDDPMGALQVADEMDFRYRLRAHHVDGAD